MDLKTTAVVLALILTMGCSSVPKKETGSDDVNKTGWKTIGYGGGGAMFYPEVSPFDPSYAFVACDMTGNYVTYNGGESWKMFNLHGPVHYFVFDPLDQNTVYASSIGLFKSTDKGATWKLIYPTPAESTGFVSKGDHAEERIVTKDTMRRDVQAIAVDPENSNKIFAAIAVDKNVGLYISEDGGDKWSKEKELDGKILNVFILPSSPKNNRTLFLTGGNGITVRDNGKWISYKNPEGVKRMTHFTGGFNKENNKYIIYAISGKSYFNPDGDKSGIFYTEDGGASWQNKQDGLVGYGMKDAAPPEFRTIATSAAHPGTVYVSYNRLKANEDSSFIGVAKSEDFGKTWTLSWKDIIKKSGNVPSANFNSDWINDRFGPTWGENPFSIGVSPVNPEVCYGTDFGRTVKTTDGGKTWEQVNSSKKQDGYWTSRGLEVTTGYLIVTDPFDKKHVFICNTDIGLMESRDGAVSWKSATQNNGVPKKWQNSTYWMVFDPEVKNKAWAVMSDVHDLPRPKMFRRRGIKDYDGSVMVTEDGGKTWKGISEDIGGAAMTHILIDLSSNKESRTLYACAFGKGIYKSVDGGKTWQQKNKGIEGAEPFSWRITKREKDGVLFLVINRRSDDGSISNDGDGALYRSDDGAESWTKITLPAETNGPMSIYADEENPGILTLSAWGRATPGKFTSDIGGGIFQSADDGKTWKSVLNKDQHIHDISYDARNKTYYACGFGGSAYRSEDKGKTWTRIKGYNFKWGKRVDPDPADPSQVYIITFGGGVWHGPAKGDDSSAEDIISPVLSRN